MSLDLLADSAFGAQPLQPISFYKAQQTVIAAQLAPKVRASQPVEAEPTTRLPASNERTDLVERLL